MTSHGREVLLAGNYYVHPSAFVDEPCEIGEGSKIWHFSHVMPNAKIGKRCIFGQNVHIASDVVVGDNVKIQNNVSLYTGAIIEDDKDLSLGCWEFAALPSWYGQEAFGNAAVCRVDGE